MGDYLRTCRLCGNSAWEDDLIKYSTRAYAHPACFIRQKTIKDMQYLPEYQRQKLMSWMDRKKEQKLCRV